MLWTFELYRILTAQRVAQALLEAEHLRLAAEADGRRAPGMAAHVHPGWWIARAVLMALSMQRGPRRWEPDAER